MNNKNLHETQNREENIAIAIATVLAIAICVAKFTGLMAW